MPETNPPLTSQNQLDWHSMLHDLEKSVERMSDALDGVRMSVRRLIMAEPWLPQTTVEPPVAQAPVQPHIPAEALEPVADAMTGFVVPPPIAAEEIHHAELDMAPPTTRTEEAASERLVERFVEEARSEPVPVLDDDDDSPDAVRRAVEETRTELASDRALEAQTMPAPASPAPVAASDEDARESVRRAVEQARAELSGPSAPPMQSAPPPALPPPAPVVSDDDAAREAVRRAVEQARAELSGYPPPVMQSAPLPASSPPPAAVSDDDAAREAVRRAVEEARAEMSGVRGPHATASQEMPPAPRQLPQRPVNPTHLLPTLTIEDPEARVELARVYALLQSLGVAAQSSLLNYTARQVSVMLGAEAAKLTPEDFAAGVRKTMKREGKASIDGANVIVELGGVVVEEAA